MVRADKFSEEMSKLLAEYGEQVTEAMKEAVPMVAKKATEEVRSHAPTGHRGKYKKAIQTKKTDETNTSIKYVIWAGPTEFRLSHLLENGHAKINGKGRTKAIPHFKYGETYAKENLIPEIVKKIGG
jgi:hypothetical protein